MSRTDQAADSLWRDRDFMLLFVANTLSLLGTAVTQMALPLTAVQILHASASDMGVLAAFQLLPFIIGLPAGVWIDRSKKRALVIGFNLFAAAGLALIPLAALTGHLSLPLLYLVGAIVSTTEAVGGSALQVFITLLVGRERLVLANSKLSGASSAALIAGPALAAALVALFGAPIAITADAFSFIVAATLIARIGFVEPPAQGGSGALWLQVREGLVLVWHSPVLRALVWVVYIWITLNDSFKALYVLQATRGLGLGAGDIALINALGAVGGLLGAALAHALEHRLGGRGTMIAGVMLAGIGYAAYGIPDVNTPHAAWAAGFALLVMDCGAGMYVVNYLSMRQAVTPDALLGRVVTTMRFLTIALAPFGTIAIGYAADAAGLVPVIVGIGTACFVMGCAAWRWLPDAGVKV